MSKPNGLVARYRCRRCGEVSDGVHGGYRIVHTGLIVLTTRPAERYFPPGCGLSIGLFSIHSCQDGGVGISDLLGGDPEP